MKIRKYSLLAMFVVASAAGPSVFGLGQDPGPGAQPAGFELVVPAGTVLPVALTTYLNTRSSQVGDTFYGETIYPVYIQQRLAIPTGSLVRGDVTQVIRPGRIKGKGRIAIRIDNVLLPNGVGRDITATFRGIHGPGTEKLERQTETIEAGGSKGADAESIVGSTGQGAIIGAIADRGSGAAIGAGAGAVVGLATVFLSRGRDLVLEPGTQFDLELIQPLRFAYGELDFTSSYMNNSRRVPPPRPRQEPEQQNRGGFGLPRIFP